jgi:DNA invertase Pin-like site-specific DNA recombinase
MDNNAIIYLRVSTKAQGDSGLGLEAQLSAVENYTKANGMTIIHRYTEVESGKVAERIQLR